MSSIWQNIWPIMEDTHCHLQDYPIPKLSLETNLKKGLVIHQMTTTPEQFEQVSADPIYSHAQIKTCLGLYPLEVDLEQQKLAHFLKLLPQQKWVGEIGLDFSLQNPLQIEAQIRAFETILEKTHRLGGRVLSIHSRRSADHILSLCSAKFNGSIILHWFSGDVKAVSSLPDHLFFSINTAMLKSRNGKELLKKLPLEKILLESDGPYILRNKTPVESWQLTSVIEALAKRHQSDPLVVAQQIHQNYLKATQV